MPTKRQRVVPCIVLVGTESGLQALCEECAQLAAEARVVVCDLGSMATRAAAWRPFALVISRAVLELDPQEFAALARAVDADLIVAPPERIDDPSFKHELVTALREAFSRRKRK